MLRRFSVPTILALLLLALSTGALAQGQDLAQPANEWASLPSLLPIWHDDDDEDDDFAGKVAGSYYLEGTLFFLDPDGNDVGQVPFFGLQTFGADGTLVSTDNGSFVNPANPQTPGHGHWVRSGPLQVKNNGWIFLFGDFAGVECPDPPPPLPYCLLAVPVGTFDFAPDFESAVAAFETRIWLAGDNPVIDPPLVPWPTARGEATLTRIPTPE